MIDFAALTAPFPADAVSWRVGSTNREKTKGMALAFIDARDVMDRFDAICGPGGWQCRYPHANGKTVCEIGLKLGDEWVWKADGAGDTDVEAEKGALSDAFKRAAVRWGVGRYLYALPSPWVEIEAYGRSYKIKDSEVRKLTATAGRAVTDAPPAQLSPAVTAAKAAIDLCRSEDELTKWSADNKAALDGMSNDDKAAVRKAYAARLAQVRTNTPFDQQKEAA